MLKKLSKTPLRGARSRRYSSEQLTVTPAVCQPHQYALILFDAMLWSDVHLHRQEEIHAKLMQILTVLKQPLTKYEEFLTLAGSKLTKAVSMYPEDSYEDAFLATLATIFGLSKNSRNITTAEISNKDLIMFRKDIFHLVILVMVSIAQKPLDAVLQEKLAKLCMILGDGIKSLIKQCEEEDRFGEEMTDQNCTLRLDIKTWFMHVIGESLN